MEPKDEKNSADEIEVTPAMIEAGVIALRYYDWRFESEEEVVERVFRAMNENPPRMDEQEDDATPLWFRSEDRTD